MGLSVASSLPSTACEAARLVIDSGRTISAVAAELGLGAQLPGRWVGAEKGAMKPEELTVDERAEVKRLRQGKR